MHIVIEDLWWKYKGTKDWTLKGINLEVKKGEILGIMGPSGAGKTTLGLTLNGLIPQTIEGEMKGNVIIDGLDTQYIPVSDLVKKVGMVFQDPETQFVSMSVDDELAFGLENLAVPHCDMQKRIDNIIKLLRIEDLLFKHPAELSGGQKQRVAIASSLILEPDILLLDEPTSDLDPIGKSEVFSFVEELSEKGMTMIFVEHEAEELARFADRIILIENGHILKEGDPHSFFSDVDLLRKAGIAPPETTEFFYDVQGRDKSLKIPINTKEGYLGIQRLVKKKSKGVKEFSYKRTSGSQNEATHSPQDNHLKLLSLGNKNEPIIEVENLEYTYEDGTQALHGVDLTINSGEYVGLIGQNGSGKTTLAKILANILKPTKGTVAIDKVDNRKMTQAEVAAKIGYSFQNPDHQLVNNTVQKEVEFAPIKLGVSKEDAKKRGDEMLELVGLSEFKEEHPLFMGKGQRKLLAVASVLTMYPRVVVVDEPTTGQDWRSTKNIMSFLDQLNKEGSTIIIITHNMRVIAEHTNRLVVMHKGKVAEDGPVDQVFSKAESLRKMFIKPPMITRLAQASADYGFPPNILTVKDMGKALKMII